MKRKPYQGILNIIRFNWHFYAAAGVALLLLHVARMMAPHYQPIIGTVGLLIIIPTVVSLLVSFYVYDVSDLYTLNWLKLSSLKEGSVIVNINAGFDETSVLLANKFPQATLVVYDFYDPAKHTEVSIKRARKAYPPYPGTVTISTEVVPLPPGSANVIYCILSAHEIRNGRERSRFFQQLGRALKSNGRILVAEHTRDVPNLLAYNLGAFHFHSGQSWRTTFADAGLLVVSTDKITPFITVYYLRYDGTAA